MPVSALFLDEAAAKQSFLVSKTSPEATELIFKASLSPLAPFLIFAQVNIIHPQHPQVYQK